MDSAILKSDEALGIIVGHYVLDCEMFKSDIAEGPVPTLFSSSPETAKKALSCSPELAFECLQALVTKLLARHELTVEEAEAYISSPIPRVEKRPYQRAWEARASGSDSSTASASPTAGSSKDKGNI